ncbi:MAG TPA: sulfite exporter TauE/SafE family protein [Bacteriovoracaceae bacterium]|nr:sulfite exporter TauE/SafE family protein [Bacteriovoracaceae bacterium]
MDSILLLLISVLGGFLGSLLGLGGGIIVVPALTLIFGVDIRYAIAASLISIVATSTGAAARFLKDHLTNLRLAVLLELGTVTGAMTGFLISTHISGSYLYVLFGFFLFFSAVIMLWKKDDHLSEVDHPWSVRLKLSGNYTDNIRGKIFYKVANVPLGLFSMYFAGILSALLGIGSGIFKVMAMDGAMKLPMKVSSATSNFMIGVTAAASAGAFFLRGDIRPEIACPVSLGIIAGSWVGAGVMTKLPAMTIRKIFVVVLFIVSIQMINKGLQ